MDHYIYPDDYSAVGAAMFQQALGLDRAAHFVKYESIHGSPPGLIAEQLAQRKLILVAAHQIIIAARNREMDKAMEYWKQYRRMSKE